MGWVETSRTSFNPQGVSDTSFADEIILIVEDDHEINLLVCNYLNRSGYRTVSCFNSEDVAEILARIYVSLIVLDINLPSEDGFALCVRLRRASRIPIIMLTAKTEDADRILGLEIGADDYICKPFNPRELLARIRAVLRRQSAGDDPPPRAFIFDGWRLQVLERRLYKPNGEEVSLTSSEFHLLLLFCEEAGRVMKREKLLELTQSGAATGRSIDILVSRIRRKIEKSPRDSVLIRTVRSGGYVFSVEVQREC